MTTETQTFQAPVFTAQGKQGGTRQLPEGMFDGTVNVPVMHQAVKAFLANRRQGTAKTKTRGLQQQLLGFGLEQIVMEIQPTCICAYLKLTCAARSATAATE